jgi:hypothetical protein
MVGAVRIVVTSLDVSLDVFSSTGLLTVATFVTLAAAVVETFTVSVTGGKTPSDLLHVSVARIHAQPVPPMAVAVRPAGRVSTTVTTPEAEPAPTFETVSE